MEIKTTMDIWKKVHLYDNKKWVAVDDLLNEINDLIDNAKYEFNNKQISKDQCKLIILNLNILQNKIVSTISIGDK